jgi:phosphoglycolate phosphatase
MGQLAGVTAVFDLDGTLVDTAPDILRALEVVIGQRGLAAPPAEAMRLMVGHGARVLIERASAAHGVVWPTVELDTLTEEFVAVYAADIARASRPFPGVEDALARLEGDGARLAVCTNKRTRLAVQLLDALGLAKRFAAIVGPDAAQHRKPSGDHYRAAVSAASGTVARSVMIGDSSTDVGAARDAGAPCIAVRFGYCEEGADALGADLLIDHFDELHGAVQQLMR